MFGNNRNELRQVFFNCWRLKQQSLPMDAMQSLIVSIIEQHPEYHALLADENFVDHDFSVENGESNPFLHMSMHIALHEQISTNRPEGICDQYHRLCKIKGDAHSAEHAMMECLGEALWKAQRDGKAPDELAYLDCLKEIQR